MTFPTVVKKSGPITISKTGSGSKTLSPRSPGSPLNISIKSSVKALPVSKAPEKNNVGSSAAAAVKKLSVPPKSPTSKPATKIVIDPKSETTKILPSSATTALKKPVNKPPPLKLNIKAMDVKELQLPATSKSIPKTPKTPTTLAVKSQSLPKSPSVNKSISAAKSSSVLTKGVKSPSSPITKLSVSSPTIKSPVTPGIKSSTTTTLSAKLSSISKSLTVSPQVSALSKSSVVSSQVTKSPSIISKTTTTTSKLSLSTKPSTSIVKPIFSKTTVKDNSTLLKTDSSKDNAIVVKPKTPIKKAAVSVLSTKDVIEIKLPTTSTNKSPLISRSSSTASSIKSMSLKTPSSPSKLLTKEPSITKMSSIVNNKTVISKSGPISPKIMAKKELSNSSLPSIKSSSTIISTSPIPKTTNLNVKVTTSTVSKNVVPKSPILKAQSVVTKPPSTSSIKSPLSPAIKITTPLSPTIKKRTSSLSTSKAPLSPVIKKMVPTKLILSPGLTKSKSLSSSRLSSVSTESLTSRISLKSPISPKPIKVTKNPLKVIKKTEEVKVKSIRGGQSTKKTIDIPGITDLPSNFVFNKHETQDINCTSESVIFKEEIESIITQIPVQNVPSFEESETNTVVDTSIDDCLNLTNEIENKDKLSNDITNVQNENVIKSSDTQETIVEDSIEPSSIIIYEEHKQDGDDFICKSLDFVVVKKDECVPHLTSISQSADHCGITFNDNHFERIDENVEKSDETQSYFVDMDFEPMNDKLVLGDVPFETDSSDISDNEQTHQKELNGIKNCDVQQINSVDDVFSLSEDLSINDFDKADSTDDFIQNLMPKSIKRSEGSSSISTDDGSFHSRKSYSEAVLGSSKDGEYYFDFDFDMADDCLDYDDEDRSTVFVEMTEKEFPELKPKDLSGKRRRNKKQKKRNHSNKTESQSDYNTSTYEIDYNHEDFDSIEFCRYIKIMKDCSFYPSGLFSSDSVKLSTASWLDISVRTADDDLTPSTEFLNTYEIFQASNLTKDFLSSIIGSTTTTPTTETTWFWKSIEGRHQTHNKTNITLSFNPMPKHLTTPRFMTLLALISEAKGYEIVPALSEHFVTVDCYSRFDNKIRRLMVQGFWLIGRLIKESLSEDEAVNCGNPFEFVDGDIGFWWAGINMLDWQEYMEKCGKNQPLLNCYQFVMENMNETNNNYSKAILSMNADTPDGFFSELDVDNYIHTVRNVKYYCDNYFVDSAERIEAVNEEENGVDDIVEWEKNSVDQN